MAIRTEDHSDMTKFGNRLWNVMKEKGYTTPRALAASLYDQHLVTVKSKPGKYIREEDIRKNAISSVEKNVVRTFRFRPYPNKWAGRRPGHRDWCCGQTETR